MITALDTNILLDLLIPDAPHAESTSREILALGDEGELIISEATYSEIGRWFQSIEEVDSFLETVGINFRRTGDRALFTAGQTWITYARRRTQGLQCASCGMVQSVSCQHCSSPITSRQHVLADFLIGAHAEAHADVLLTRDRGFYQTYYPNLRLA